MRPFDSVDVLLQVRDGLALDLGEYRLVGCLLAEQTLEVTVELPDAGQQGAVMPFHLGEAKVDTGIERIGGWLAQHVSDVVQPLSDGVQHGGLQADRLPEAVESMEEATDSGLAPRGQRPLQVLPLKLLWGAVRGTLVLGRFQQTPPGQGSQGSR